MGTERMVARATCSTVPTMAAPTPKVFPFFPPVMSWIRKLGNLAKTTGAPLTAT